MTSESKNYLKAYFVYLTYGIQAAELSIPVQQDTFEREIKMPLGFMSAVLYELNRQDRMLSDENIIALTMEHCPLLLEIEDEVGGGFRCHDFSELERIYNICWKDRQPFAIGIRA